MDQTQAQSASAGHDAQAANPPTPADSSQPRQGWAPPLTSAAEREFAIAKALDYRGDVTLFLADGKVVEGYIYDRRHDVAEPYLRVLEKDTDQRLRLRYADLVKLVFSGRDTAEGKTWENWVRKYLEKKARGEEASLHADE
ncbi:MAG: hypothetical protein IT443_08505 [Phycisphaeraceae bacterium]|nr:hypothetical protein [Phycisphaeraceae bacterium]